MKSPVRGAKQDQLFKYAMWWAKGNRSKAEKYVGAWNRGLAQIKANEKKKAK